MFLDSVFYIAKKEFIDNVRNKWIIIMTILFAALAILASYAGSIFGSGWQDLAGTMSAMSGLVRYLISIIALILGYSAIIGEIEKGSMNSLLSLPTTRKEILTGKIIGLGTVITFSILVGFGIAGIIIGLNVENVNYGEYLFFIISSIFMGLIFLVIGLLLSIVLKKRSTAMGAAIFVWVLFAIIWIFIVGAIIIASGSIQTDEEYSQDVEIDFPDAYWVSSFFNPLDSYSAFVTLNIESVSSAQGSQFEILGITSPDYYNSTNMLISMLAWFFTPLVLAYWRFEKREI